MIKAENRRDIYTAKIETLLTDVEYYDKYNV